ncbi:MAG: hypothetical protein U1E65_05600 [Myxococcota bacterium]
MHFRSAALGATPSGFQGSRPEQVERLLAELHAFTERVPADTAENLHRDVRAELVRRVRLEVGPGPQAEGLVAEVQARFLADVKASKVARFNDLYFGAAP